MAGVCFYFEPADADVWSGKNLDAWNYAAKAAGDIDKMIVINRTLQSLRSPDAALDFRIVAELPELSDAVYCVGPMERQPDTKPLWGFDHQVAWYCFGPAAGWDSAKHPTLHVPQAGIGALHAVHIASVVLLHRFGVRAGVQ